MPAESNFEKLIRLADVPKVVTWLPTRRGGKKLALQTLHRWVQRGLRGVTLETVKCGGTRCVTEIALMRFFEALQAAESNSTPTASKTSRAAFLRAEKELDRAGIGTVQKKT